MSDDELHTQACVQCRRKKRKCSKTDPCRSCVDGGIECFYVDGQKRGTKPGAIESLKRRVEQLESMFVAQSMMMYPREGKLEEIREAVLQPSKRRKVADTLPSTKLMHELCEIYFTKFHPWIPILHESRFMSTVGTDEQSEIILQAITAIAVRFSSLPEDEIKFYYEKCRERVILASMDEFSVETLQASTIIAYDIIGNGRGPRSWSVISSATRIVEQMGLAREEDESNHSLLNRMGLLNPSKNKTELEERRRLFWSIFLLDRFCSVTTGWGTSLTSGQVKRRLPIDGGLWKLNTPQIARYFNIAEAQVDSTDSEDCLGGYAYLVEASDMLSRIANFLLQTVEFKGEGTKNWFREFQVLDSMLIRWKTFLPAEWQVVRLNSEGIMDENLTLAHVTYNTSVLLLHQNVAYPSPRLGITLPAKTSADRCLSVAIEISTITKQFLSHITIPISPQFALCAFVAGRTILAHSRHFNTALDPNFGQLTKALREMSARWKGKAYSGEDLAGNFAMRLENACNMNLTIDTSQAVMDQAQHSMASPPFASVFRPADKEPVAGEAVFENRTDLWMLDIDQIFAWEGNRKL
ncbi:fungal-specific transcription factor domain-containing protein [Umbelopsis sp. PMI_123]|nr:fungal-specific transcription factor domain-containing protein [Umbelopsis sp. PMI_123]